MEESVLVGLNVSKWERDATENDSNSYLQKYVHEQKLDTNSKRVLHLPNVFPWEWTFMSPF